VDLIPVLKETNVKSNVFKKDSQRELLNRELLSQQRAKIESCFLLSKTESFSLVRAALNRELLLKTMIRARKNEQE